MSVPAPVIPPQAGDALWLVPVLALLKGLQMFTKLFPIFRQVLALLSLLIVVVEDALGPGTGPEKRAKVIADFKAMFTTVAADFGIPSWLAGILTSDAVLGVVVDLLVAGFNKLEEWPGAPAAKPAYGPPVA